MDRLWLRRLWLRRLWLRPAVAEVDALLPHVPEGHVVERRHVEVGAQVAVQLVRQRFRRSQQGSH
jgi:hypothetical protein